MQEETSQGLRGVSPSKESQAPALFLGLASTMESGGWTKTISKSEEWLSQALVCVCNSVWFQISTTSPTQAGLRGGQRPHSTSAIFKAASLRTQLTTSRLQTCLWGAAPEAPPPQVLLIQWGGRCRGQHHPHRP